MSQHKQGSAINDRQRSLAIRRILSDYRELRAEELVGISAIPMEDDIFEWHINVRGQPGPLWGYFIHCIMRFTDEYPLKAPQITACVDFGHANVLSGGYICLSMLEDKYGHDWRSYEKWSSAYSLTSILLQLQSFLLDERRVRRPDTSRLRSFKCSRSGCNHSHASPVPAVLDAWQVVDRRYEAHDPAYDNTKHAPWPSLPRDISSFMLGFLDAVSLRRASWTNREWSDVVERYNLVIRHEMICYHSKASYNECVLGFGMSAIAAERNNPYKLHMDYLSHDAWHSGLRTSAWGERLVSWIPLVINKRHSLRAERLLIDKLQDVHVEPVTAVARLMNGLVVSLAKTVTNETTRASDRLLLSEKTLIGYFALHQILLWLVAKDEKSAQLTRKRVAKFRSRNPSDVSKTAVPDMGEYLVYLSCVDNVSWKDVARPIIFELWKRHVLWYTRNNSGFNYPSRANVRAIFESTRVSRAIVMFQVFFVSVILNGQCDVSTLLEEYSARLGRPSYKSVARLQKFCRYIASMKRWSFTDEYDFYWNTLKVEIPATEKFVDFLKWTVQASATAGYHKMPVRDNRRRGGHGGNRGQSKRNARGNSGGYGAGYRGGRGRRGGRGGRGGRRGGYRGRGYGSGRGYGGYRR